MVRDAACGFNRSCPIWERDAADLRLCDALSSFRRQAVCAGLPRVATVWHHHQPPLLTINFDVLTPSYLLSRAMSLVQAAQNAESEEAFNQIPIM